MDSGDWILLIFGWFAVGFAVAIAGFYYMYNNDHTFESSFLEVFLLILLLTILGGISLAIILVGYVKDILASKKIVGKARRKYLEERERQAREYLNSIKND